MVAATGTDNAVSGQGLAQSVVSALSSDNSHLAFQAWAADGATLAGPGMCKFAVTSTQGAAGS